MVKPSDSEDTCMLELKSLQLDVQTLQTNKEADKKEFLEFSANIKANV